MEEATYAESQVLEAAHRAAGMLIDELELLDSRTWDLFNLFINAMGTLLQYPEIDSLDKVIRCNWDEEPAEVWSWVAGML